MMMIENLVKLENMSINNEMIAEMLDKNTSFKQEVFDYMIEGENNFFLEAYFDCLSNYCNWEFDIECGYLRVTVNNTIETIEALDRKYDYFTVKQMEIFDNIKKLYHRWCRIPYLYKANDLMMEKIESKLDVFFNSIREEMESIRNDNERLIHEAINFIDCGNCDNYYFNSETGKIFKLVRM